MNKKEAMKHKKTKKFNKLNIPLWILMILLVFVIVTLVYGFIGFQSLTEIFTNKYYFPICILGCLALVLVYLLNYRIDAQNVALDGNDLEDTEWATYKTLKKNPKKFTVANLADIPSCEDRPVISAEKKAFDVKVIEVNEPHAIIVGTTGSGKTTGFVDQNIAILSRSKTKPSFLISDPKMELYEKHAKGLENNGYKIVVINLRDPYTSTHWNPFNPLIRRIKQIKAINNCESRNGKYYAGDDQYKTYSEAQVEKEKCLTDIYEYATELIYSICPVKNKDQPTWEEGARDLILAMVLAFCEDCINNKMDEDKLILFNVYHNITRYLSEDTTILKNYLIEGRDQFSNVPAKANTVLLTSEKTLTSYLSQVSSYMQQFADSGILSLTSDNEIDIQSMDEEPTAVFIIVPDERFSRHGFVTMFISQIYKELVDKANKNLKTQVTTEATLQRSVYFVLDEFGQLPAIDNMGKIISVARSRKIKFLFVVQSFSQLDVVYGRDGAKIIKDNCNVKIFIGTDDAETRKEFSELCGQKKITSFSVSTSTDRDASSSTGANNQPLITVGMLERLNGEKQGDAIVSVRGCEPIFGHFTPSYELPKVYFKYGKASITNREAAVFDKTKFLYDIINPNGASTNDKLQKASYEKQDEEVFKSVEKTEDEFSEKVKAEWIKVKNQIDEKCNLLRPLLSEEDGTKMLYTKIENKADFLDGIAKEYDQATAKKIKSLARFIEEVALPQLKELEELRFETEYAKQKAQQAA